MIPEEVIMRWDYGNVFTAGCREPGMRIRVNYKTEGKNNEWSLPSLSRRAAGSCNWEHCIWMILSRTTAVRGKHLGSLSVRNHAERQRMREGVYRQAVFYFITSYFYKSSPLCVEDHKQTVQGSLFLVSFAYWRCVFLPRLNWAELHAHFSAPPFIMQHKSVSSWNMVHWVQDKKKKKSFRGSLSLSNSFQPVKFKLFFCIDNFFIFIFQCW